MIELTPAFAKSLGVTWTSPEIMSSSGALPGRDVLWVGWPQDRVRPHPTAPWKTVIKPTRKLIIFLEIFFQTKDLAREHSNPQMRRLSGPERLEKTLENMKLYGPAA